MEKKKTKSQLPQAFYWMVFFALAALCDCLFISCLACAMAFALIFLGAYLPALPLAPVATSLFIYIVVLFALLTWGWRSTLFICRTLKDAPINVRTSFVLATAVFLSGLAFAIANVEFSPPHAIWNGNVRLCLPWFYEMDALLPEVGVPVSNFFLGANVFAGVISRVATVLVLNHRKTKKIIVQN